MQNFISEVLDKQDLKLIDTWRKSILEEDCNSSYHLNDMVPIEGILEPWASAKSQYLYRLLGNKIILSKYVKIAKDEDLLCRDYENAINSLDYHFNRTLYEAMLNNNPNEPNLESIIWNKLFNNHAIVKNIYEGPTIILKNKNNELLKLQQGMKLMKAYRNIIDFYKLNDEIIHSFNSSSTIEEEFIYIRNVQSQVRNQAYLEGNLCISIHPLDYMTMSDNDCNWESCMHWREGGGDYRQGTIEMMNSWSVVVAYLEAKEPFYYHKDFTWNNKKWRQLFIVHSDCIAAVKGYPYQNNALTQNILNWLADLAKTNLNWQFLPQTYEWNEETLIYASEERITGAQVIFSTNYMYNDFGSLSRHYIKLKSENTDVMIDYSGPSECMICGKTNIRINDSTKMITCFNCSADPSHYCCNCGNLLDEEETYYFDDWNTEEEYCEDCFYDLGIICPNCGEHVHNINTIPIYLIENDSIGEESIEEIIKRTEGFNAYISSICKDCVDELRSNAERYFISYHHKPEGNVEIFIGENNEAIFVCCQEWKDIMNACFCYSEINYSMLVAAFNQVKSLQRIY